LRLADYRTLGGYMDHVRPLSSIVSENEGRRRLTAHGENPWPLEQSLPAKRVRKK
jgi:hypothetical protein